jgi:hypothetical protein
MVNRGLEIADLAVAIYVVGVVWGLIVIDARPMTKIALAVLWPLGPIAFAVTITVLIAASLIAFPALGVAVVIAAAIAAWWMWV